MASNENRTQLKTFISTIELNDLEAILITEIVQDTDGAWVREFRFLGTPEVGNVPAIAFTVRAKAAAKEKIEVTTPSLDF